MGLSASTMMDVREAQLLSDALPMLVTLPGMVTKVRLEQSMKALSPILFTLEGMLMAVRPLQPEYLQLAVYQFVLTQTVEK